MQTGSIKGEVNIGSCNGSVPSDKKSLLEQMLSQICVTISGITRPQSVKQKSHNSRLYIAYFLVDVSFWDFSQSMIFI